MDVSAELKHRGVAVAEGRWRRKGRGGGETSGAMGENGKEAEEMDQ